MANEITAALDVRVVNGSFAYSKKWTNKKADQAAVGGGPGTVSVTTTEMTVAMTGYGYVILQNLGVNFVQVGRATGSYMIRLRPGGPPLFLELEPSTTLYVKADTATTKIQIDGFTL